MILELLTYYNEDIVLQFAQTFPTNIILSLHEVHDVADPPQVAHDYEH